MHLGLRSFIIVRLPYSLKYIDFNLASLELTTPFSALVYYLCNLFEIFFDTIHILIL